MLQPPLLPPPAHRVTLLCCILAGSLAACASRTAPPSAAPQERHGFASAVPRAPAASVPTGEPLAFYPSVDRYKETLARHVVSTNAAHTFSGPLPMMLPSIVVLRLSVDRHGNLTDVAVQRSRDDAASGVALAAIRRSAVLPSPHNLIGARERALTFSETFLFNKDYRFQLRSLALPQPLLAD